MAWLYREVPLGWPLRIVICALCASCNAGDQRVQPQKVAATVAELGQAGRGGSSGRGDHDGDDDDRDGGDHRGSAHACTPRDSTDTTCDGRDDDCDGQLDEDCDYGPSLCPRGSKRILGTVQDDWLVGTDGRDCILGYGGDDMIFGLGGDDVLVGGPGADFIAGSTGKDLLIGGAGDDWLYGGSDDDQLEGGDGNDILQAEGNDVLHGGACHDRLFGAGGSGWLLGDGGSDRITGDNPQRIDGGAGYDACRGNNCETSSTRSCTSDRDCSSGMRCLTPVSLCVPPSQVPFDDATCDGVDDDCDGAIDEDFRPLALQCGVGACRQTGTRVCEHGHTRDQCTPGTPAANDTSCDGVDDDCDGRNDDEYVSLTTQCGMGACARSGATACENGHVRDACAPGTPAANDASCDGVDDDCDGRNDDDYAPLTTQCGVGACARSGATLCEAGHVRDACAPGTPAANDASCDGIDDDCDGRKDDDYVQLPTQCGVGACARSSAMVCEAGHERDACAPGTPAADDASCDGIDDDCDGGNDEDFITVVTSCGVGMCARLGATVCSSGAVFDTCVAGAPDAADASCDGIDDDCDGRSDEDYAPVATSCGVGACASHGSTSCIDGNSVDSCSEGTPASSDATCDSVDDDCDGELDEDYVSIATSCEVNGCLATGQTLCIAGGEADNCASLAHCVAELACSDRSDNDGDGRTDCADSDCRDKPICARQNFALVMSPFANIFGAGHTEPPGGGAIPPFVALSLGDGATVTFASVTGALAYSQHGTVAPDGILNTAWSVPNIRGISGYSHATLARPLVGVFLSAREPVDPAPARLQYQDSEFTQSSPALGQMFVIGDGRTSAGIVQRFIVPRGATRLFFGITDTCDTGNPGCYDDNFGSYRIQGELGFQPP